MDKRLKMLVIAFAVITGLLVCRLAYIQLLGNEELSAAARTQQEITLEGADTRGTIYDRNGTPIAGQNQEYIYIIESDKCDGETQNALSSVGAEEVPNEGDSYRVFTSQEYSKSTGERLIRNSGAYILEAGRRYRQNQPAVHMIGYVNPKDNSGASGLELMYDDELSQVDRKVSAVADVYGDLLQGYGLTVTSANEKDFFVKEGITTTLELGLQKEVESILDGLSNDGAAVVVECSSGEIVAAASTPVYNPAAVEEYMDSTGGELINKVTQGEYPPGSVFKIVVAAAGLEAGISPEAVFECSGSIIVNGHSVKCSTGGESGHGEITFRKAFAESCNCAFISIGQKTGAEAILNMAERLGFGKNVLDSFPGEADGNLMTLQQSEGAAIANLSIGQGETLVTPLQVAGMTAVVANDGVSAGVRIVKDNQKTEQRRCISAETAAQLQDMMIETALSGTGSGLGMNIGAGMKTGSAQGVQAGVEVTHGWITGYVPANEPEYVITVFVEDGKSGRGSAGPVFKQIADYIEEKQLIGYETGI